MLRRMKRPPGIWLLLSAGVLCLCFKDVSCVRATALIFAKSTTTTSTTTAAENGEATNAEGVTVEPAVNVTKSPLTGNPQMDYVHDPNLPRELNGYNLTEYPFYALLPPPDQLNFKCDGLHDGFYSSIEHKCQVYHHCLYGTRFDFLCANYTAFDQKTFICQFVSEVDCVNSKKYWHRNDALYETPTTTTQKPIIIYRPPPMPHPALTPSAGGESGSNRRPSAGGRRRRPYKRRRPQYEYYDDEEEEDDYYDDEPRYQVTPEPERSDRRRTKRPRPRPRPVYDDEYEDEDERYDRRGDKRRGMDDRRYDDRRRYKDDRRKYEDEYDDAVADDEARGEDRKKTNDDRRNEKRRGEDNPRYDKDNRRRKPNPDDEEESDRRRKPKPDEEESNRPRKDSAATKEPEDRPREGTRDDDDSSSRKTTSSSQDYDKSKNRRPTKSDVDTAEEPIERSRPRKNYSPETTSKKTSNRDRDRDRNAPKEETEEMSVSRKIVDTPPEGVPLVKPSSGTSIFDRPRAAPKVRPPVPKSEQDKYSYKTSTAKPGKTADEEYYDDYEEEEPPPKRQTKPKTEASSESRRTYKQGSTRDNRESTKMSASRNRNQSRRPANDDDYERPSRPKNDQDRKRKRPVEYDDEYVDEQINLKPVTISSRNNKDRKTSQAPTSTTSTSTTTTTTTTTTPAPPPPPVIKEKPEPVVRVVKRPFLPSRGGSPFTARGLLPVGSKAPAQTPVIQQPAEEVVKQPPFRQQLQSRQTYNQINKIPERNPLDITENEYDVTLNDALNPTLPNLPVRNFPTSAFSSPANDYTYTNFRRTPAVQQPQQQKYVIPIEPQVSHSQKQPQTFRFQDSIAANQRYQENTQGQRFLREDSVQVPNQRYQENTGQNQRLNNPPQPLQYEPKNHEQLVNSNSDYRAQFSHVPVTYQFRTGPRVTHVHAQPFYTF